LQKAYQNIRGDLAAEILEKIKSNSPQFFERLVVDIMVALGYGGSRVDAGKSIGQSGDEGIDVDDFWGRWFMKCFSLDRFYSLYIEFSLCHADPG
jgi:alcohol dehydrogenase class IV